MKRPSYARAGRAIAHSRSLPRLGMASLTIAGAVALVGTPIAQAGTLPQAFQQMVKAMSSVHSYKMTMDISATGAYPSKSHMVAIYIRNGKALSFDVKMQSTSNAGKATTIEMVLSGSRLCMKGITSASWTCSNDASLGAAFNNLGDLTKLAQSMNTEGSMTYLGQRTVQGQLCSGYAFTNTVSSTAAKGTMWINASTHLLTEEDAVTSTVVLKGSKPTVSTLKAVVSNYNDPNLTLPKV